MKGVGSIRRAILRGGLRFRGGTTISSEAAEAKRFESCLLGVEKEEVLGAALEDEEGGENADEDITASEVRTAAE